VNIKFYTMANMLNAYKQFHLDQPHKTFALEFFNIFYPLRMVLQHMRRTCHRPQNSGKLTMLENNVDLMPKHIHYSLFNYGLLLSEIWPTLFILYRI
jgi:hypothetical protein